MIAHNKKQDTLFYYWLIISMLLVFFIILIGGLTRLTNSGLSITEWELFKGVLPPLTQDSWEEYFLLYKQIPQYKLINFEMTLSQFKVIFYWEYFHRVLGRIIGIFFLIPLIYFHFSKKIRTDLLIPCYLVLFLIITQGIIGWMMVQSGLTNDVTVSHFRLSLHLTTAIVILTTIFWIALNFKNETSKKFFNITKRNIPILVLLLLVFLQIIFGAFVSGLDAGRLYQSWPLMGVSYIPNDINLDSIDKFFDFNNHSLVQFYHRNIAYFIFGYTIILNTFIFRKKYTSLYKPVSYFNFLILIQIFLGVITLISNLNIFVALSHQIFGVILVISAVNLYYCFAK